MKVLWTSNIIFPEAAAAIGQPVSVFGGWLTSMADDITGAGVKLAIASLYTGRAIKKIETAKAVYYLLPGLVASRYGYDSRLQKHFRHVLEDFKPDCIHIHGTEYAYPQPLLDVAGNIPAVVSIQGMIGVYERFYLAGMRVADIIRSGTPGDLLRRTGVLSGRSRFRRRAKFERKLLSSTRHVIGRTEWDYSNVWAINPRAKYHLCNESLRSPFYAGGWDLHKCERHTLFTSQASYPIKGLHILLEAVRLLKPDYPDIRLSVGGPKITNTASLKEKLLITGYGNYIRNLIRDYGIESNVEFTGALNADAMAGKLAATHVYVLASSIENSPNSLGEAQLVGTPCVASYVGGVPDMVTDGEDGLLYNYLEPAILANKIRKLFEDDELAQKLSIKGRERALVRHDRQKNLERMLEIYSTITGK